MIFIIMANFITNKLLLLTSLITINKYKLITYFLCSTVFNIYHLNVFQQI